jgi:hypothetical protein
MGQIDLRQGVVGQKPDTVSRLKGLQSPS